MVAPKKVLGTQPVQQINDFKFMDANYTLRMSVVQNEGKSLTIDLAVLDADSAQVATIEPFTINGTYRVPVGIIKKDEFNQNADIKEAVAKAIQSGNAADWTTVLSIMQAQLEFDQQSDEELMNKRAALEAQLAQINKTLEVRGNQPEGESNDEESNEDDSEKF